ncbi:MAG TPA: hypothetical protein VLF90_00340 [Patescibacteria group bacterium]|nr:hypothetical protein [Patescibacteria group bacterium]
MADQLRPSLEQQIAGLATQTSISVKAPERFDFINYSPLKKWVGHFDYKYNPPTIMAITETVFRGLGVSEPYKEVSNYIEPREKIFLMSRLDCNTSGETIGEDIDTNAPLRQAFANLETAFTEIHGPTYNRQLEIAKKFSFWLVERANSEA